MKNDSRPNYKLIYRDIIIEKYPEKEDRCRQYLLKTELSDLDVVNLNHILFKDANKRVNQKLRSYNRISIIEMLEFQKKNNLNNTQLANHFKLSRNTVAKWKKIFLV